MNIASVRLRLRLLAEDEAEPKHGTLPEACRVEPAHRVVLAHKSAFFDRKTATSFGASFWRQQWANYYTSKHRLFVQVRLFAATCGAYRLLQLLGVDHHTKQRATDLPGP
jgi:hypothetical protein